jgi:hypothetical protein
MSFNILLPAGRTRNLGPTDLHSAILSPQQFHIVTCITVLVGFGFVIGFIDHSKIVTTNNHYTIADFHTTNRFTQSLLSLFPLDFTW